MLSHEKNQRKCEIVEKTTHDIMLEKSTCYFIMQNLTLYYATFNVRTLTYAAQVPVFGAFFEATN